MVSDQTMIFVQPESIFPTFSMLPSLKHIGTGLLCGLGDSFVCFTWPGPNKGVVFLLQNKISGQLGGWKETFVVF